MSKVDNFYKALAKKGWTQKDLAKEAGVSGASVHSFVRTLKSGKPQPATAKKYADKLGIDVEKLL